MDNVDYGKSEQEINHKLYETASKGKNIYNKMIERNKYRLLSFKSAGIKKVEIVTARNKDVCDYCKQFEGKIIDIDEALRTMPIPGKCSNEKIFGGVDHFCRCIYVASF